MNIMNIAIDQHFENVLCQDMKAIKIEVNTICKKIMSRTTNIDHNLFEDFLEEREIKTLSDYIGLLLWLDEKIIKNLGYGQHINLSNLICQLSSSSSTNLLFEFDIINPLASCYIKRKLLPDITTEIKMEIL